jgi:hypothetical protein
MAIALIVRKVLGIGLVMSMRESCRMMFGMLCFRMASFWVVRNIEGGLGCCELKACSAM